ncbi:hypothetical protein [Barrientosiimonas humi]|uniref:hypothetical protein n=1 Tax=Barrientosiimonas humi TaxID=999931 RepID=UPI00370D331F
MAIELTESAAKRGYTREDAIYLMEHAYVVRPEWEESRVPGGARPWLWLGPSRDALNPVLEMFTEVIPPDTVRVFHLMPIRQHFREQFAADLPEEYR